MRSGQAPPPGAGAAVVISGVSSGIGCAAARELVRRGYRVFGTVRRREDARRLQRQLGPGFVPLELDVCDQRAVAAAVAEVRQALAGAALGGLVNNAGTTVLGPLAELDTRALEAALRVTQARRPRELLRDGGRRG